MPKCFFAHLGNCQGRLVQAHLVPKSSIRRELFGNAPKQVADPVLWDERCWRLMCGGATGLGGHHGAYDAKQIRLDEWPQDFIEFLAEYDLLWMAEAYARV